MLVYKFDDKEVILTSEIISIFNSYRQLNSNQHESGGILLGRIYTEKIVIETVSVPSFEDRSGRNYFERNVKKAQKIVNQLWEESGGEIVYLGEWHTHPEKDPIPSPTDRSLLNGMLRDTQMDIDFLFLVIVGIQKYYVGYQIKGRSLQQL
ncbi:Mov34/MPN/PAD-1 family protein [Brevibacillus sp. NPDC003359]|uniref:Mov34/MPN/PAD-1 family protein n=1 Tax=unclassified Brevibacillus TaxID=2684853 RepID=UPI00369C063F